MKASRLSTLLFAASLLLPLAAFSANTNKKSLHLSDTVTVEGKTLSPGDYRLEWSGSGPDVQLEIVRGRDTVATVSAKIVTQSSKHDQDGYVLKKEQNGGRELSSIFFDGKNYEIQIEGTGSNSSNSGASGTN